MLQYLHIIPGPQSLRFHAIIKIFYFYFDFFKQHSHRPKPRSRAIIIHRTAIVLLQTLTLHPRTLYILLLNRIPMYKQAFRPLCWHSKYGNKTALTTARALISLQEPIIYLKIPSAILLGGISINKQAI